MNTKNIGNVKIMNISYLVSPDIIETQILRKNKYTLLDFRYFKNRSKAKNPVNNENGSK